MLIWISLKLMFYKWNLLIFFVSHHVGTSISAGSSEWCFMLTPFPAEKSAHHLLMWEESTAAPAIIVQMETGASIFKAAEFS